MEQLIHTSDRLAFKACRRSWDWSSPLRCGYRKASTPEALWFGTGVHHGLEAFYLDKEHVLAFSNWCIEHKVELIGTEPSLEQEDRYFELVDLGCGMLRGYANWVDNSHLVTVGTEVRFRVPLNIPGAGSVLYVGKADGLSFDTRTSLLWINEFKTTAQFGNTDFLGWDEQCTSYAWAFECVRNGIGAVDTSSLVQPDLFWDATRVEGILYDDLRKKLPAEPKVLVNGTLSVAKNQDTTYDIFMAFLSDNGYKSEGYSEFLAFLKTKPNNFYRRTKVRRNSAELSQVGLNVHAEAKDMINTALPLYPNPGYRASNCQRCGFQSPCLATNDGMDPSFDDYIVKTSFEGDEFFYSGSPEEVNL